MDKGGLRLVFPMFMGKSRSTARSRGDGDDDDEQRSLSLVASLLQVVWCNKCRAAAAVCVQTKPTVCA